MSKKFYYVITVNLLFLVMGVCQGGTMTVGNHCYERISVVPQPAWDKLAQKKIYFGHQSVGFNIIDGINDLMKDNPQIKLNIIETTDIAKINNGIFAHSRIGQNRDPKSKIKDFKNLVEQGLGNHVDIAFFKLCMVDFDTETDAENLFSAYRESMSLLERSFPKTTFMHITAPVTTDPPGFKKLIFKLRVVIKKIQGEPVYDFRSRAEFNQYLRDTYRGKAPLFDLAEMEATFPNGKFSTITMAGNEYLSLVPEYTYDGGHLNAAGRRRMAEKLLLYIVSHAD